MSTQTGKASNSVIKRSVLKLIKKTDKKVEKPAAIGNDCAVIKTENEEIFMSTETGIYPVIRAVNNVLVAGAKPIGAQDCIILPRGFDEADLKTCIQDLNEECRVSGIQITGGHTQVSEHVKALVSSVTATGVYRAKRTKLSAGMDIVVTKWIGMSGAKKLIEIKRDEILDKYTESIIAKAECDLSDLILSETAKVINKMAEAGVDIAATDISMGGILAALWNFGEGAHVGMSIDLKKIPVKQEIIEICEMFDVNPYELDSCGSMIIGTRDGKRLVREMEEQGIPAVIIGKVTDGNGKLIFNDGEERFMDTPKVDQIERFLC